MKLKFRAWDKDEGRMWSHEEIDASDKDGVVMWGELFLGKEEEQFSPLMLWTGLLDSNGKEIWEGDIVVGDGYIWFDGGTPNYRGTVEWIYSQWQVVAHCVNHSKQGISDGINEGLNEEGIEEGGKTEWEVIGNIYENPDLLGAPR